MPLAPSVSSQSSRAAEEVAHRGNAALHQLAQRDLGRGAAPLGIDLEQRQVFVERAHIKLAAANLVGQPLQHRLGGRVSVDVDKARQNRKATPVDLDRIAVIARASRADRGDRVALDHQIDITAIDMGLRRRVPGDEPGGIANDYPRRGWRERVGHGIAIEANCARQRKLCRLALSAPAAPNDDGILVGLTSPFHARMPPSGLTRAVAPRRSRRPRQM